jgi:hypothetical protein
MENFGTPSEKSNVRSIFMLEQGVGFRYLNSLSEFNSRAGRDTGVEYAIESWPGWAWRSGAADAHSNAA